MESDCLGYETAAEKAKILAVSRDGLRLSPRGRGCKGPSFDWNMDGAKPR
jgi:hypothetical protein